MKAGRIIAKIVAIVVSIAAVVYLVRTYWDTLEKIVDKAVNKVKETKALYDSICPSESDYFADM